MSFRRLLVLFVILVVAVAVFPAEQPQSVQAGGDWFAYVYSSPSKQLLRVHLSGQVDVVPVAFSNAENPSGNDMVFGHYGDQMAYCVFDATAPDSHNAFLAYWTLTNDGNTAEKTHLRSMGSPIACRASMFDPDEQLIAVGLVNYFPGDPNADPTLPLWSLQILDLGGVTRYELNPSTPGFVQDPDWPEAAWMPEVLYFANNMIVFRQVPWGVGGPGSALPAYRWDLVGGTVEPIEHWGAPTLDGLMDTGELVWTELDPSLPAAVPEGPLPQVNVVKLSDKTGNPPRTIYTTGDGVIGDVKFIDGGARLAISLMMPSDPAAPAQGSPVNVIGLDRTGATTILESNIYGYSVIDYGPSGYLFFRQTPTGQSYTLEYVTPDGMRQLLWQASGQPWEYVWGMGWNAQPDLNPFPDIAPVQSS